MWRTLTCLGLLAAATATYAQPPGQERRQDRREDRREDRRDAKAAMHGKIVRVDPTAGSVVVQVGTGTQVKEVQYRVDANAKFFGPDKAVLTEALRFQGFKPGAEIWFMPGETAGVISELYFYDPAVVVDLRGKIVRVDQDRGVVVILVGEKEVEYRIDRTTRFWGADQAVINEGLRHQGFKAGAEIWVRPTSTDTRVLGEVRFYDPAARPARRK